jgi:hypothetical protein
MQRREDIAKDHVAKVFANAKVDPQPANAIIALLGRLVIEVASLTDAVIDATETRRRR